MRTLPANIEAIYPLTPMQKALLVHSLAAPAESPIYFQQVSWKIEADLNVALFHEAWVRVVHRHPALRTFFVWENRNDPIQCVCARVQVPWREHDWSDVSEGLGERLEAFLAVDRARAFRPDEAPLVRFHMICLGLGKFQFVWSFHHIIMDGWCLPRVTAEALALYRHLAHSTSLELDDPPPYRDFVAWLARQDHATALEIWRQKLRGFRSPTTLRLEAETSNAPVGLEWVRCSAAVSAELATAARKHRSTPSTLVQAAWALLLRCYSGEDDVVFGVTIAGRPAALPGVDQMVGLFINTLPARVQARSDTRLPVLFQDLMAQQIQRDELSHSSLSEIQAVSEIPRGALLFESIIIFENYPVDAAINQQSDGLAIRDVEFYDRTNFPLTLLVVPGTELALKLSYDTARFGADSVRRLLRNFRGLLEQIAATPNARVSDLDCLSRDESELLRKVNKTAIDWDLETPLHGRIEAQVQRTPDAVALIVAQTGREITYGELNCRANQVAHLLVKRGVCPDEPVGIYMERSAELVIALLATLKSGAAYVPLEPSYPAGRIALMLQDTSPRVILTQTHLTAALTGANAANVIALDAPTARFDEEPGCNPQVPVAPENLAYIVYTSGSTGQPKGAMNTHRAISNRLLWMQEMYQLDPQDRVLQKTPFSFDVSIWEFFWPLLTGAQLVIAEPGGHHDPAYLIEAVRKWSVTTIHFVPSMLRPFLDSPEVQQCMSLRRVICSGEPLAPDLAGEFFTKLRAELHNLYGPTEAAVDVTAWQCHAEDEHASSVPIGRPIANTEIHLLDRDLHPVPVGVPGELYIGGLNVGRGYWHTPARTADKFIPDSFSNHVGARLYATGDLARRKPNGVIEYLGRLDHQVKIRGVRIEPGEIEGCLMRVPGVKECAVISTNGTGEDKRLIGYVVSRQETPPSPSELRRSLENHLPEYMVPSAFTFLSKLPLTASGKLDRRALPEPDGSRPELDGKFELPRTEAEHQIAEVWREVLRINKAGAHDHFFELGGNSLLLLTVQARLQRLFCKPIPLVTLFRNPTVALLAQKLTEDKEDHSVAIGSAWPGTRENRSATAARLRQTRLQHRSRHEE
jgi:surfactin family lipopeptide synthetase C